MTAALNIHAGESRIISQAKFSLQIRANNNTPSNWQRYSVILASAN